MDLQKKVFWGLFIILGLIADIELSMMWSLILTIPILLFSWWVAYRSGWIE